MICHLATRSLVAGGRGSGAEIKIQKLEEWTQEVEIVLRVRAGLWRTCLFVLPFEGCF